MKERLNAIAQEIIAAAIAVHTALGPGLLESAYEKCLVFELVQRGFEVEQQKAVPLVYNGVTIDCAYRADIVVNGCVVVEIKSVERLNSVHMSQMISYLRLTGCPLGLILNFNVRRLMDGGLRRVVNNFPD